MKYSSRDVLGGGQAGRQVSKKEGRTEEKEGGGREKGREDIKGIAQAGLAFPSRPPAILALLEGLVLWGYRYSSMKSKQGPKHGQG